VLVGTILQESGHHYCRVARVLSPAIQVLQDLNSTTEMPFFGTIVCGKNAAQLACTAQKLPIHHLQLF
jgi:hypothetical protein